MRAFRHLWIFVPLLWLWACQGRFPDDLRTNRCQRLDWRPFSIGVNVVDIADTQDESTRNDGARGFGSAPARRQLVNLREMNLDAVLLPLPLHATDLGATSVRGGDLSTRAGLARLARMIDDAHRQGLRVILAPHLALDDGAWRGELAPFKPPLDQRHAIEDFFLSYTEQLRPFLMLAEQTCVEGFSVAVEFKSLSRIPEADSAWEQLVSDVRAQFHGTVLYSANWDEARDVRHWARFDRIGIQAFFPLAHQAHASDHALRQHAVHIQEELLSLRATTGKPIWYTELGFKAITESWIEPWKWPAEVNASQLPVDEDAQRRAYQAVIDSMRHVPAVDGVFFWMVPSDPDDDKHPWAFEPPQGFSFLDKRAEGVVRELTRYPPRR
jgi:hypothetical protein